MIDTNEALGRIAVAEFEARLLQERSERRARKWRLAVTVGRIVLVLAAAIYAQLAPWPISGAQACGFVLVLFAGTVWTEHRTGEYLRRHQAEVERLKDELQKKSA